MNVAGDDIVVGIGDPDQRSLNFRVCVSHGFEQGAVRGSLNALFN
jgi:hypothetical protein